MSTDSITIAPTTPAVEKKTGKGRKFAVAGVLCVTALVGFALGKSGGSDTTTAAPAQDPVKVTVTAPNPPQETVTVTAPPVTVQAPAPAPVTVTEAPPAPVVTGPAEEITKSGIYVVGTDIKAGKWKTDGKISAASSVGYFAILADPTAATSDVDNILTNDNPDGQAFATLEAGQGLENNNLHWTWISE